MDRAALAIAPPMQEHDMTTPQTLVERMDRQERALGELRNDTAKRFAEQRAHTNASIETLRSDVHDEFKSVNRKLDRLIAAVDRVKERRLLRK